MIPQLAINYIMRIYSQCRNGKGNDQVSWEGLHRSWNGRKRRERQQLCRICFFHISGGYFPLNQLNSQWCERWGLVRQPADSTWNGLSNSRASENQQGTRRQCFIYLGESDDNQDPKTRQPGSSGPFLFSLELKKKKRKKKTKKQNGRAENRT